MIWVVSLIIALVAYFLFQGLHARHISRCHTDTRTAEHVPDSITAPKAQAEFHKQSAVTAAQVHRQRVRDPQHAPSLLYGDRNNTTRRQVSNHNQYTAQTQQQYSDDPVADATQRKTSASSTGTQCTSDDFIDMDLDNHTADHTLEFTAEHEPLRDVGVPADHNEHDAGTNTPQQDASAGYAAVGTAAAAAAAAGIAGATSEYADATDEKYKHEYASDEYSDDDYPPPQNTMEHPSTHIQNTDPAENIDVELGENDGARDQTDYVESNSHDELLDFGDLTSDISDMLKELNLRETDSPRLDINQDEFKQLKTGEPGEVKPAKIENVADKLRNMLQ